MGIFGWVDDVFGGGKKKKDAEDTADSTENLYTVPELDMDGGLWGMPTIKRKPMDAPDLPGVSISRVGARDVAYNNAAAGQAAYGPRLTAAQARYAPSSKAGQAAYAPRAKSAQAGYGTFAKAGQAAASRDVVARQAQQAALAKAGQAKYAGDVYAQQVGAWSTDYDRVHADPVLAQKLAMRDALKSEFANYEEDPSLRSSQMDALGRFEELSREGYSAEDRAAMYGIQSDMERAVRSQREGIAGQAMRAGAYGSGMQYMMQLQGAQDQNQVAAQMAMEQAAQGQRNRRDALAQYGDMAGEVRGQDYAQFSDRAKALDNMSMYNEDSAQRYELANADFDMRAQLANQDASLRARMSNQSTRLASDQGNADRFLRADMANQGAALQADQGNQSQRNQVGMYNAGQRTQVNLGNMQATNDMRQFNTGQQNTVAMNNQQQTNQVGMYNAGQRTQASIHNSGQTFETNRYNAGLRNTTNIANMNMVAGTNQFNAGQRTQSSIANMNMKAGINTFNAGQRNQIGMANQDMISRTNMFNAGQQTQVNMHNSTNQLRAQEVNASNHLQADMFNSGAGEREQMYAREALQWDWAQQLAVADRRAQARQFQAGMQWAAGQDESNIAGSIVGGIFKGGAALFGGGF